VVSSAGTLGGFSGGLGMKKKLLALEAAKNKRFTAKSLRSRRKAVGTIFINGLSVVCHARENGHPAKA
jgi:hypothetical protein